MPRVSDKTMLQTPQSGQVYISRMLRRGCRGWERCQGSWVAAEQNQRPAEANAERSLQRRC